MAMVVFNGLRAAAKYAGVTPNAVRIWTTQADLGQMIDGRWVIDKDKLDRFLALRKTLADVRAEFRGLKTA